MYYEVNKEGYVNCPIAKNDILPKVSDCSCGHFTEKDDPKNCEHFEDFKYNAIKEEFMVTCKYDKPKMETDDPRSNCEMELTAWCKKYQKKLNGKKFKNITEDEWFDLHMEMLRVFVHFLTAREGKQKIKKALKTLKEWNGWFVKNVDEQHCRFK